MTDTQARPLPAHNAYIEGCDCPNCRAHRNYLALNRTPEAHNVEIFAGVLADVPGAECIVLVVERAGVRDTFPLSVEQAHSFIDGMTEAVKVFSGLYQVKIVPPTIPAQAGAHEVELPA